MHLCTYYAFCFYSCNFVVVVFVCLFVCLFVFHLISVRQNLSASFSRTVFQLIRMGFDVVLKGISCTSTQHS